jgi:hypothetical protein
MAVNTSRSMNGDRKLGEEDGMMKSIAPDRGGVLEESHALERAKLLQTQYNVVDKKRGVNVSSSNDYEYGYADKQ